MPIFRELENAEILELVKRFQTRVYMPRDCIIEEGNRTRHMYFIKEGIVEIIARKSQDGDAKSPESYEKIILKKDEFFGEIEFLTRSIMTKNIYSLDFSIIETLSR